MPYAKPQARPPVPAAQPPIIIVFLAVSHQRAATANKMTAEVPLAVFRPHYTTGTRHRCDAALRRDFLALLRVRPGPAGGESGRGAGRVFARTGDELPVSGG